MPVMEKKQPRPAPPVPRPAGSLQWVQALSARGIRIKESILKMAAGMMAVGLLACAPRAMAQDAVLSFKAHFNGQKTKLYWSTAPGTRFNYFAIERSWNGERFETIGLVGAQDESSGLDAYAFTDKDYYSSIVYYRLRLVGQDMRSRVVGNIIAIQLSEDAKAFNIAPYREVPGAVYIDGFRLPDDEIIVDAVNREKQIIANGILKKQDGEPAFAMQTVRKLKPGTYVISAFFDNRVLKTKLVVREPSRDTDTEPAQQGLELTRNQM
jgi:hypothetical protein